MPMDYGGLPCKINELRKICDDHNLLLIEDAPITENIADTILTLPIYPGMTTEEQNYLVDSVCEFFELNS